MAPSGSINCIVCGDTINPRTNASINFCSDCKKPYHTKCAGRKKDAPCDLCRAIEQRRQKKYNAIQQKRLSAELTLKLAASNTSPKAKEKGSHWLQRNTRSLLLPHLIQKTLAERQTVAPKCKRNCALTDQCIHALANGSG